MVSEDLIECIRSIMQSKMMLIRFALKVCVGGTAFHQQCESSGFGPPREKGRMIPEYPYRVKSRMISFE